MADETPRMHKYDRHEITMLNRELLQVSGVVHVESFDAQEFVLDTAYGLLVIRGDNLHIKTLNLENGLVAIEGTIFDIGYFNEKATPTQKAKGIFGKLFR